MISDLQRSPHFLAAPAVVALSISLAGCGGGSAPVASAPQVAPVVYKDPSSKFSAFIGSFTSEGLATRLIADVTIDADSNVTLDAFQLPTKPARATFTTTTSEDTSSQSDPKTQNITTTSNEMGSTLGVKGGIVKNSADLYKEGGESEDGDFVGFTNELTSSLGTKALSYAYVGMGVKGTYVQTGSTGRSDGYVFALFGGQKTADMPTAGSAVYEGAFKGIELELKVGAPASDLVDLDGSVALNANFGSKAITGRIDNIRDSSSTNARDYSIGLNGAISGNQFTGTAVLTQKNSNTSLSGANEGVMTGGFFGPTAIEAAGALTVKAGSAPDSTRSITGVFGATKK